MAKGKLKNVLIILAIFFFVSWIVADILSIFIQIKPIGNVALIPIKGTILIEGTTTAFGGEVASSAEIVDFIKQADEDSSIKAILLDINSPGGSAVASKEIMTAVKRANKPTYALIREIGTSGAYWVASASDKIIADELSVTGSIGVIASYLEFNGLLERYNISYQRLVGGKYKDIGSPFKELGEDERVILQTKIDKIHEYFIGSFAENRNMSIEKAKELSTGEFYLGSEALELGLIDQTGDIETAKETIKTELNLTTVEFAEYKTTKTLIESLAGVFSDNFFFIGKGIGSALTEADADKFSIKT